MSTRSTAHFTLGEETEAIIYRHSDGYPEVAGRDLLRFFDEVRKQTRDTRFSDPTYLAAKYVVFLAGEMSQYQTYHDGEYHPDEVKPLNFLSVGVMREDPGDIEYRYIVDCARMINGRPYVEVQPVGGKPLGEVADVLATLAVEA